jgi:hypothetical protein
MKQIHKDGRSVGKRLGPDEAVLRFLVIRKGGAWDSIEEFADAAAANRRFEELLAGPPGYVGLWEARRVAHFYTFRGDDGD